MNRYTATLSAKESNLTMSLFTIFHFNDRNAAGNHFVVLGQESTAYGSDLVIMQFHCKKNEDNPDCGLFPLLIRRLGRHLAMEQAKPTDSKMTLDQVIELLVILWRNASVVPANTEYPFNALYKRLERYSGVVRSIVSARSEDPLFLGELRSRGLVVV